MKRRFMMWMTIVWILVVGVSVTRMTHNFVMSQRRETAAGVAVSGEGVRAAADAGLTEAAEISIDAREEMPEKLKAASEETAMEKPVQEAAAEHAAVEAEEEPAAAVTKTLIDTTKKEAIQETVKSPLDPVVAADTAVEENEESRSFHAKDFFERFAQTEQKVLQLWENVTSDNRSAYLAVAEQERLLWEYELNQVSQAIRERLTKEEIEEFKVLEIEWVKERELYAERAISKSSMKNAQGQNPDYTRALAERTKERCYWLVSEYEDVLNED